MTNTEELLSASEVAGILGIHVKTLYRRLRENKIAITYVQLHGGTIAFQSGTESTDHNHTKCRE